MIRLAFALWLGLSSGAFAAVVVVKSGEHDGFTRLVLEYAAPVAWQVGRTDDGYLLRIANSTVSYDISDAFRAIGKGRLAGISTDPKTGDLRLAIACACYAIPFEFRPGIVVIDLRDGKPPKGSSFEQALAQPPAAMPGKAPQPGYDWTQTALANLKAHKMTPPPQTPLAPMPSSDPALQTLREALLQQFSRGASQGIVDVGKLKPSPPTISDPSFASARVGLGELPGVSVTDGLPKHDGIGAEGQSCIDAARLDISTWADDTPIFTQMAGVTQGLIKEFDKTDPDVVQRAIRFYLFIGFGAEAKQLLQAFPGDQPDRALWQSMANLVDGSPDPQSAFLGQQSCDSPSAMWAMLAQNDLKTAQNINSNAAYLAFSALPIGLRRDLGPTLADRFMAIGAVDVAMRVRDAILRAPGGAGAEASLLQARIEMQQGAPAEAEITLKAMIADPGPRTPTALVALVQAQIAQDLPVEPSLVVALEAIVAEKSASNAAAAALVLAKAASGDMKGAFALLPTAPETEPQLWRILAILGSDDAILLHGILPGTAELPPAQPEVRSLLAKRLLGLGMADSALQWLVGAAEVDPNLLAKIQLQRHDGRAAVRALTGDESATALALRAQAMQQLGEDSSAALLYEQTGDSTSALRAWGRVENWSEISAKGAEPWKQLASQLANPAMPDNAAQGSLGQGNQLVENSATTRQAVESLLRQVAAP